MRLKYISLALIFFLIECTTNSSFESSKVTFKYNRIKMIGNIYESSGKIELNYPLRTLRIRGDKNNDDSYDILRTIAWDESKNYYHLSIKHHSELFLGELKIYKGRGNQEWILHLFLSGNPDPISYLAVL